MILTSADSNRIFRGLTITGGLKMNGCVNVTIIDCDISGGFCNIRMTDCQHCRLEGNRLDAPTGPRDESGNGPHSLLMDNCLNCKSVRNKIKRNRKSEMGIGFYKCSGCVSDSDYIFGPSIRQSADAITIDYLSHNCTVINPIIDLRDVDENGDPTVPLGHSYIVCASGYNNTIVLGKGFVIGSVEDHPIAITSYYNADGDPTDDDAPDAVPVGPVFVSGFDRQMVYVGPMADVHFILPRKAPKKPKPKPKPHARYR